MTKQLELRQEEVGRGRGGPLRLCLGPDQPTGHPAKLSGLKVQECTAVCSRRPGREQSFGMTECKPTALDHRRLVACRRTNCRWWACARRWARPRRWAWAKAGGRRHACAATTPCPLGPRTTASATAPPHPRALARGPRRRQTRQTRNPRRAPNARVCGLRARRPGDRHAGRVEPQVQARLPAPGRRVRKVGAQRRHGARGRAGHARRAAASPGRRPRAASVPVPWLSGRRGPVCSGPLFARALARSSPLNPRALVPPTRGPHLHSMAAPCPAPAADPGFDQGAARGAGADAEQQGPGGGARGALGRG
jgi:hypothetical protein